MVARKLEELKMFPGFWAWRLGVTWLAMMYFVVTT